MNKIDLLIDRITRFENPSVIGLDTDLSYLPSSMTKNVRDLKDAAQAIAEFNLAIIERIYGFVPAIKIQSAYYEQYGVYGMAVFAKTIAYAKSRGMMVIGDVKRNDIGSTASAYSRAFLSGVDINGQNHIAYDCDFITVSPYLGRDGIMPFVEDCKATGKGIFVLVKTSNPSSGEIQDRVFDSGEALYETMGDLVSQWGADLIGENGYSSVGAVVGATYPEQADFLRFKMPNTFFLVPGYGAQGATAEDLRPCFDHNGSGAIVNSSRAILTAHKKPQYEGLSFDEASEYAAREMQHDLLKVLQ